MVQPENLPCVPRSNSTRARNCLTITWQVFWLFPIAHLFEAFPPEHWLAVTEFRTAASDNVQPGNYSSGFCPGFSPVFPFQPLLERVLMVATTLSRCKGTNIFLFCQIGGVLIGQDKQVTFKIYIYYRLFSNFLCFI